jgi:hypothetical protein
VLVAICLHLRILIALYYSWIGNQVQISSRHPLEYQIYLRDIYSIYRAFSHSINLLVTPETRIHQFFSTARKMFYRLWAVFASVAFLFGNIHQSVSTDLRIVAICADQPVNMNYLPALPGATASPLQQVDSRTDGVWDCTVKGVPVHVRYFISFTLTSASCEKATFSTFLIRGNVVDALGAPASIFNLSVDVSDELNQRALYERQNFTSKLTVEGAIPATSANATLIFPSANHQNGACGQVSQETIQATVYAYIP